MTDKREQILVRLLEIASTIQGVTTAVRNKDEITDKMRPAIIILDADENAADSDPNGRSARSPRFVTMTPEVYIILGAKPENVGTEINVLRARWLKAVLSDTSLSAIVGSNGDVRYEGCATSLARGRNMEGELGVSISFTYVLRPDDL